MQKNREQRHSGMLSACRAQPVSAATSVACQQLRGFPDWPCSCLRAPAARYTGSLPCPTYSAAQVISFSSYLSTEAFLARGKAAHGTSSISFVYLADTDPGPRSFRATPTCSSSGHCEPHELPCRHEVYGSHVLQPSRTLVTQTAAEAQ